TSHGSGGSSVSHCPSSGRINGLYLVAETARSSAVPTCSQPRERISFVQCSTCRSGLVEEPDSTDSLTTAKALVVIVGTVRYSGTMRNQVARIAALFGRRPTLGFAGAGTRMLARWIAAGGLHVETAHAS